MLLAYSNEEQETDVQQMMEKNNALQPDGPGEVSVKRRRLQADIQAEVVAKSIKPIWAKAPLGATL